MVHDSAETLASAQEFARKYGLPVPRTNADLREAMGVGEDDIGGECDVCGGGGECCHCAGDGCDLCDENGQCAECGGSGEW